MNQRGRGRAQQMEMPYIHTSTAILPEAKRPRRRRNNKETAVSRTRFKEQNSPFERHSLTGLVFPLSPVVSNP